MKFKIRKIGRILNFEDQKYKSKVIEKIQTNFQKKKIIRIISNIFVEFLILRTRSFHQHLLIKNQIIFNKILKTDNFYEMLYFED